VTDPPNPLDPELGAPDRFSNHTLRIGEYNGLALVNETAYAVWTGNSATGQQTVTANLGSVGGPHQCSTSIPQSVIITIVVNVAKTMPFITVTNTASVASGVSCAGGNRGSSAPANKPAH